MAVTDQLARAMPYIERLGDSDVISDNLGEALVRLRRALAEQKLSEQVRQAALSLRALAPGQRERTRGRRLVLALSGGAGGAALALSLSAAARDVLAQRERQRRRRRGRLVLALGLSGGAGAGALALWLARQKRAAEPAPEAEDALEQAPATTP